MIQRRSAGRGIQMDRNLKGKGGICLMYLRAMNLFMKTIAFATYSSTFYECDCDVEWVKQLYTVIAEETGWRNKIKYRRLQRKLPIEGLYVRKLCLLDSLIGLSYLERGSYENARKYAYLIEHIAAGEDSASNEARQKLSNSLQEIKADIEQTKQAKHELIETFLVNADSLEEMLKAENYSGEGFCSGLMNLYAKACGNCRTLEAFGHRAMGGLMIDHESRSKLMDAPTPPPDYKPSLYLNT